MRKLILVVLLAVSLHPQSGFSQNRIGDWQTFTSMMNVTDITVLDGKVYATTTGGLLIFNPVSEQFTKVTNVDGLSHTDLQALTVDQNQRLWLAAGAPAGNINIWSPASETMHKTIPLDQSNAVSINYLVEYGSEIFGAATRNLENIVVHYNRLSSGEYDYRDFYNQFPVTIGAIQDIAVFRDRIYLATDVGLIRTRAVLATNPNLKASSAWERVSGATNYTALAVTNDVLNIATEQSVWQFDGTDFTEIPLSQSTSTILTLTSLENTLYLGARLGLFTYDGSSWTKVVSQSVPVTAIATEASGKLWVGTLGFGLATVEEAADSLSFFQPNCPFTNEFSAMVHANDYLIAASEQGLAIYHDDRWSNFLNYRRLPNRDFAEYLRSEDPTGDYWTADTMNYRSSRPFDAVVRSDNQAFVSHEGSGVLRFNLNDMTDYQVFDTTDGHLSGSEGIGGGSPTFIVTRDITLDHQGTLWIANAFAANGNALTAYTADGEWVHFNVMNPNIQGKLNLLPVEIAADNQNRIWVATAQKELDPQSPGGIAVLDFNGTLADQSDDRWIWLNGNTNGLSGMTCFSISITSDNVAYVVTDGEKRVQKYRIPAELPASSADIFFRTDRIDDYLGVFPLIESEADTRNNIWFISASNGIKMRTSRGELLNDAQGYNADNSPLLSDNVYAIESAAADGIAYFSTDFGISAVTTPYASPRNNFSDVYTFPSPYYIPNSDNMVIAELPDESEVKILTVSGEVIKTLSPNDGSVKNRQAFWDGTNENGDLVGSGVYFIYCYTQNGEVETTKALVVRQ